MKIYTQTYDLSKASPHRFWVAPYSEFKIGIKLLEKDEISDKDFTLKAGSVEFTPDEDKIDNFTLFTIKSNDTGFVEYTIEVEGVAEKLKLMQIVTDSTVFEIDASGGDVPADVATQTWVNSQISDFITDDALTAYATKDELTGYVENDDLTAYYTKSETSSAAELSDAFANVGGGAISAFDLSESPVWSKTMVENALNTNTCLPQTIILYHDDSISVINIEGTLSGTWNLFNSPVQAKNANNSRPKKVIVGTNVTKITSSAFQGYGSNSDFFETIILPDTVTEVGGFSSNTKLTTFRMSKSVTLIEVGAFSGCTKMILELPDTVLSVGNGSALGSKYVDAGNTRTTVPTGTSAMGTHSLGPSTQLYVPDALYDTWIATSPWNERANNIHRHSELEAPYATSTAVSALTAANSKVTGGAETGTTGTPAAITAVKSVYESDWATLSASAISSTFYVVLPDPA